MKHTDDVAAALDLPRAGLLSNGRYNVLVTEDGAGISTFDGHALTPWREDRRAAGIHLYLRDQESGQIWSSSFEPARISPVRYEAWLAPGSFHFRRVDEGIETESEVSVAPDLNAELRVFKISNRSDRFRRLSITTYAEVALNAQRADAGHPAFSKLFVQTSYVEEVEGLLARRRPRSPDEHPPMLLHAFAVADGVPSAYETDRPAFIGRGRTLSRPRALVEGISGRTGAVLDPVLSLQLELTLDPGEQRELIFVSAAGYSEEEVVQTVRSLRNESVRADALLESTVREQQLRDELELGPKNADRYHRLAAGIFRGAPQLGPSSSIRPKGRGSERVEKKLGLDPSVPLAVGRIADESELSTARLLLKARDFWGGIGLRTQLLLLNDQTEHADELQEKLQRLVEDSLLGHDDVVIRHSDVLTGDEQIAVQAAARLWITGERADLLRVEKDERVDEHAPIRLPDTYEPARDAAAERIDFDPNLQLFNGFGGFSEEGTEYVVQLEPVDGHLRLPPTPWVNVIANETVGCVVSETGAGFTWTGNSREHRLTPWYNDPVLDPHGEAVYIRDEDSREVWCPTAGPIIASDPVEVRHGFGYTQFRKRAHGIEHETVVFVPRSDPVKIVRVRLTNRSGRSRRLSAASFASWVLGSSLEERRFVVTEYDDDTGCVLARNAHNEFIRDGSAFSCLIVPDGVDRCFTASARSFLGKLSDPAHPQSLFGRDPLDGRTGAVYDPCAAFITEFDLDVDDSVDVIFLVGQVEAADDLPGLIERNGTVKTVQESLDAVVDFWKDVTSVFKVETPSPELDLMLNGWLLYQNLSCRLWARSALYQSGGAFGFRDQLQDAGAFAAVRPEITRKQILLHASHQFEEGDVLHWWHPPTSRGIRTRFSDDLLWLPYVTLHYVETTGDAGIWEEKAPYVEGPDVPAGQDELLIDPTVSELDESVYRHCCRALDRSLETGSHGLPLIGSGDWNDGMNRVGREGRGESVWLGFFLYDILNRFTRLCDGRGETERAETYRKHAEKLREAANDEGWDGSWYLRAYYDDGEPLGSAESQEARIDALAQAWSVISAAAPEDRVKTALDAVEKRLVDEEAGIIRLLAPPFDKTDKDPGYIRGYLPGVRENGGQYTHAAMWVVMAMAAARRCERAAPLLAMMSPVAHTSSPEDVERYHSEPYVVAADVYGAEPHVGRGGWTWYTGSAGWMQRVGIESVLGIRVVGGDTLEIAPCIPSTWDEYRVRYRRSASAAVYDVHVLNGRGDAISKAIVDGEAATVEDGRLRIAMKEDGRTHEVEIVLGEPRV